MLRSKRSQQRTRSARCTYDCLLLSFSMSVPRSELPVVSLLILNESPALVTRWCVGLPWYTTACSAHVMHAGTCGVSVVLYLEVSGSKEEGQDRGEAVAVSGPRIFFWEIKSHSLTQQ